MDITPILEGLNEAQRAAVSSPPENALIVAFELASPFDIENVKVPGRVVVGQYCPWEYQGVRRGRPGGCSWDLNSRGIFFDVENNIITKDTDSSGLPNTSSNILIHSTSTTYNIGDLAFTKHKTVTTDDTIQISVSYTHLTLPTKA